MALLLFLSFQLIAYDIGASSYDFYVASNGSDSGGDGSLSKPWATIQCAQSNIRNLIASLSKTTFIGNITVNIDGSSGSYKGPLSFYPNDSMIDFENDNYVIYKPMSKEYPASIQGAIDITSPWTKTEKNGMNLYSTNIKSQKEELPANNRITEMFVNSERISMSKSDLLHFDNIDFATKTIITNNKMIPNIEAILATNYSMNLMVLIYEHWTSSYHYVSNIKYMQSTGQINVTCHTFPTQYAGDSSSGKRFYLLNNINLLSMNNQFYYNQSNMNLYLLTNKTLTASDKIVFAKDVEIVNIEGASNMIFKDLYVQYSAIDFSDCLAGSCMDQSAAFLKTATVHTKNVDRIIFDAVYVTNTGGYGVWFDEGSTNTKFINGKVSNLGAGGIRVGVSAGGAVADSLLVSNITIANNYISDGGYVYESGCGILAQSFAYSNITNNEVANFKYTGVSTGWTWSYETTSVSNNIISHNLIYNIGQYTLSDMGCIYTLGTQENSLYDNNICHDVYSYDYGGWGTYTDQASRFLVWTNNIVYNTKSAGHHQHFGLDNLFKNNIYAFNELDQGQHDGAVRSSQHPGTCNYTSNQGACSSFTLLTNIMYTNNTWNYDILGDSSHTLWKNMTVNGNTYWSVKQKENITFPDDLSIQQWNAKGKDVKYAIGDPLFVDAEHYNFNLMPGSPALALGFEQISTQNVGPDW